MIEKTQQSPPPDPEPIPPDDVRAYREAKGLSLQDLYRQTRISPLYLDAIEKGCFHLLPEPIYTSNFIRAYARIVEMDPQILLRRYEASRGRIPQPAAPPPPAETLPGKGPAWTRLKVLILAGLGMVLLVLLWLILQYPSPSAPGPGEPPATIPPAAENPAPTAVPTPSEPAGNLPGPAERTATGVVDTPAAATVPSREGTHHLLIEAQEKTWLRIREDEKPSFQTLLNPGERIERQAGRFAIDIGNAGGIEITLDGRKIDAVGKRGAIAHLLLPPAPSGSD